MSQQGLNKLIENNTVHYVKKGTVLVQSGSKSSDAFYVVKGCLRSFIVDSKGKEHIYQFAPEDWIIRDLEFERNNGKAFLTIDAVEDSEIKIFTINTIGELANYDKEITTVAMNKLHNRVYALQNRIIQLLAYSAEERYREFIKTYPNLAGRLPLKMISSYLGITPESLSRVRKALVKNK